MMAIFSFLLSHVTYSMHIRSEGGKWQPNPPYLREP